MQHRNRIVWLLLPLVAIGCTNLGNTEQQAIARSESRTPYVTKNDVEYNNYDARQRIADDPTTLLWCTAAFPVPGSPLFTVPVVGKLTSGSKRPYQAGTTNDPIGPDGMYGSSVPYRYGFTPEGVYVDFTDMATYCTTQPSVWQKESTDLTLKTDPALLAAQVEARKLLAAGDAAGAQRVLEDAIKAAGGE